MMVGLGYSSSSLLRACVPGARSTYYREAEQRLVRVPATIVHCHVNVKDLP